MSDSIDLGLRVKDFAKQSDFAEYENVELSVSDDLSVKAKRTGEILEPFTTWVGFSGNNQFITLADSEIRLKSNVSTNYGLGVFSSPSRVRYVDVSGKTLRITADIDISSTGASGAEVLVGFYLRKNDKFVSGGDGLYFKTVGNYSAAENHVDFSFVVGGDWFASKYDDAFLAVRIVCKTNTNIDAVIRNLHVRANVDTPTTTFTASCPWATPAIARQVLASLSGFHYRPYEAKGARLDPAAELGDNAVIDYTGYGIYSQTAQFNSEFVSNLSAPFEEEIDHEFPYVPSTERRFTREIRTLKAELNIAAEQIEAKVSSVEGSQATFGWTLQKDNFTVYAGGRPVLKVTQSGAEISGKVVATSGTIGGCEIDANGHLQVGSANIREINADRINAGTLKVQYLEQGKIDSPWLAQGAVTESKIGGLAVSGGKIAGGAVSYAKTGSGVSGRLLQVDTNAGNIGGISERLNANWFICNNLRTNQIQFVPYGSRTIRYTLQVYDSKPSNGKYVIAIPTG